MSERDRGMAIAMLAEAFGVKLENMTPARVRVLDAALEGVPQALLEPMVRRAVKTRRPRWGDLPTVAELLDDAEACRRELRASMKFEPCANCSAGGWAEQTIDGVPRMVRCACWKAHQAKVQQLGVGDAPLALPAPRTGDFEAVGEHGDV